MDETDKERLVERFRDYLESMEEYLPQQAPETPDLFTLLSELTALKNEVKIESRQVKTALDEFRGLFDTLQQANARLDGELGRQREHENRERQDAERDLYLRYGWTIPVRSLRYWALGIPLGFQASYTY